MLEVIVFWFTAAVFVLTGIVMELMLIGVTVGCLLIASGYTRNISSRFERIVALTCGVFGVWLISEQVALFLQW